MSGKTKIKLRKTGIFKTIFWLNRFCLLGVTKKYFDLF